MLPVLCQCPGRRRSGINMSPDGRWVAAALLVKCLLASCSAQIISASTVEGVKWSDGARTQSASRGEDADRWEEVTSVLEKAKKNGTFPGCVAAVGNQTGFMYSQPVGTFTYGEPDPVSHTNPPMTTDTLFDLASLTKVLATTTAAMILYQQGHLDLDMRVSDSRLLGPDFGNNGKDSITVRNLLLHNAGFPPDPAPNYWDAKFGCPQTASYYPAEVFSCQEKIYTALLNQTLQSTPGSKYNYSDLSMITMMYVVGTLVRDLDSVQPSELNTQCVHGQPNTASTVPYYTQCYYEAFVRIHITDYLHLKHTQFLLPSYLWSDTAPTWNDSVYRHHIMQGYVSDGNSYALGGISGHAGLFSSIGDMYTLLNRLMFTGPTDSWINSSTVLAFTSVYNTSQSSRALGWDTNNYQVKTADERLCGELSSTTFTHTGYTGTQVCCDPERKVITILLSNRCYKDDSQRSADLILLNRRLFNDAVVHSLH